MAKEIGRLHSFALGVETTSGVEGTLDQYIPVTKGTLVTKVEKVTDESGLGVIDKNSDSFVVKKMSDFDGEGTAYSQSFGYLLLLALGTAGTPTLLETGVYSHAFTRKNDNSHPSVTIFHDNATQEEKSLYHMLDTLDVDFEVGKTVGYKVKTVGQATVTTTGLSPAFTTTDEAFLVSNMSVKMADNIAGLSGASRIPVLKASVSIQKELAQIFASKSGTSEALDFNSQHNQSFSTSGELELVLNDLTYKNLYEAGTYKAIEIEVVGKTLIGATQYNKLTIRFAKTSIEDFGVSDNLDEIQTQTLGFIGHYKLSETLGINATLINTKTTIYA